MDAKKYSILIVDDDKFLLDMYSMKFTETGFNVRTTTGGQETLALLEAGEYKPDIILMDIVMPGMDGLEMLEEIHKRKLALGCTLIILSNLGQKEDIDKGMALGVDGYIIKASCTPTEVTKKVEEILHKVKK
jgi:CheY-like chemotaxis protein